MFKTQDLLANRCIYDN